MSQLISRSAKDSPSAIRWLDAITDITGSTTAWLTLAMVLISSLVVILRHGFNIGSIALQDSVTYMHGMVFMMGAAYTLKQGGHVRVDILYNRFSPRSRAWVDALGSLVFTLPVVVFIGWGSWDYVMRAWEIRESSNDSGGLGGVYLFKTLLPLMALSLGLQAFAELLRNLWYLMQPAESTAC
ncbi:TRAP transporter small permease subunit [Cellvibrio japonicus]|uniref:TRAP transporter small permease protein n=1 Tax=Cellvibrio japonicus (strain Ueda107) TaxID=498211 RepID=B3PGE0_CELJU|nr:TRAP transporter small permease subunit [Cellvibrio japonicus]ACE83899.1 TRAP transporter, DctQ-like membrane protein family [Cellvibrio japonicus Ueda107]QEI10932.1 TRAP transporter small permease subunit [Cellvibrio japonicus]QEI14508.1 TRAP transporter small permease subunit [Cellvibrio japonicus]QEI18086.1 TRAP transporter small permease subunit [Cellvibrio japonicus]